MIVDKYGRQFEYLDYLKIMSNQNNKESFMVVTSDGYPICGKHVGGPLNVVVATEWRTQ